MMTLPNIRDGISCWIDGVADTAVAWHARLASRRVIKLIEDERGEFVLSSQARTDSQGETLRFAHGLVSTPAPLSALLPGSHVELILRPAHFLFQDLELPDRAIDFLEGIVQAQIDRLTPWSVAHAAFGFTKPSDPVDGRIMVTVAAAPREVVSPYVEAIGRLGAHSITVCTTSPHDDAGAAPIKILENEVRGALEVGRVRHGLKITLTAAIASAALAIVAFAAIDSILTVRQDDLAGEIGRARANAVASNAGAGSLTATQGTLTQRKQSGPSSVLILEALSKILPDHTYVTELRIEDNKLRVSGVTRDAPSLIGLIEQSGFTQASFFAPTTRSPSEPGERFHIEAVVRPRS